MTITTQTYWDINGVPLNTYAYNISTLGEGRTGVPNLRGDNIPIPYRRGELHIPKIADARDLSLAMWVGGMDEDGNPPADGNIQAQWQANYDKVRNAIWNEGEQYTLTKRFWRGGSVVSASAEVQFVRGLEPVFDTFAHARMTVTLRLADPFFYGTPVVEVLSLGSNILAVEGDVYTTNMELEMGAGTELVNQTPTPDIGVSIDVAATLDVDTKQINGLSSPALVTSTGGYNHWFALYPGNNTIVCNNSVATITYQPAYF